MVTNTKIVSRAQSTAQMIAEIKNKLTIPMYFYQIIVPQMGSYYDTYPVEFESRIVNCCPLHDEDTPSCRYYEDTNSFYCFGCQRGGDIIALHRYFAEKMNGTKPTYEQAVVFLYNYFIAGKESSEFVDLSKQHLTTEKKNTDQDIVKFNIYRVNMEKAITFDKNISLEIKQQFWDLIDNIDILLSKDLLKVDNAIDMIKQYVKENVK